MPAHRNTTLHPATLLLLWMVLAILAQAMHGWALMLVTGLCVVLALFWSAARFLNLLRRTRWILLSLLFLYAYVTPGEAIFAQLGGISPVREGVQEGGWQLLRLLMLLAGLSLLLEKLSREELIAALHALLYPLRPLGVNRERIAVRLALTLHYAEQQLQQSAPDWQAVQRWLDHRQAETTQVELQRQPMSWRDGLAMVAGAALVAGVIW